MNRVVITGMGAFTSVGRSVETLFESLKAGHHGMGLITRFDTTDFKAKVAADMANVRAYYAELQTQYITTGEYIDIGDDLHENARREIKFLDGTTVQMQAGTVSAILARERTDPTSGQKGAPIGYQVYYICDKGDHELLLE